jgi:hypothetical protein
MNETQDHTSSEPAADLEATNPTTVTLGRMTLADARAELAPERAVLGGLHYFDPDALKAALRGELVKP